MNIGDIIEYGIDTPSAYLLLRASDGRSEALYNVGIYLGVHTVARYAVLPLSKKYLSKITANAPPDVDDFLLFTGEDLLVGFFTATALHFDHFLEPAFFRTMLAAVTANQIGKISRSLAGYPVTPPGLAKHLDNIE